MDQSDYSKREPKDWYWQRTSRKRHLDQSGFFDPKAYLKIAKALNFAKAESKDCNFYLEIDALIDDYRSLPRKQRDYQPTDIRDSLKSLSKKLKKGVKKLPRPGKKRLLLALGKKVSGAVGPKHRLEAGDRVIQAVFESIDIAIERTELLPRGDRTLENEHWLTKKLATLLWDTFEIKLSNTSYASHSNTTPDRRVDPRPREFIAAVFSYAQIRISDRQIDRVIKSAVKARKVQKPPRSEDSEDSENADLD